jgi:hypothetical protein
LYHPISTWLVFTDRVKYAAHHLQPSICKFLIQNGSDVDSLEPSLEKEFEEFLVYVSTKPIPLTVLKLLTFHRTPLQQARHSIDLNLSPDEVYANWECKGLLLDAGATSVFDERMETPWTEALQYGDAVSLF